MGEQRDWRQSFRVLEEERLKGPPAAARIEPVFPPDVAIPPPLGAAIIAIPLLPSPEPFVEPAPVKRKSQGKAAPKRARKASVNKASVKKKTRKPAAKKPRAAATVRRSAKPKAVPAQNAEPPQLVVAPAMPVPPQPLPAPVAPLARRNAPVPYRKGGLAEAFGYWLRSVARSARGKFATREGAASSTGPAASDAELARLRSENESLRRQLEALAALREVADIRLPA